MEKTIWYSSAKLLGENLFEEGDCVLIIDKIVRLSKDWDRDVTLIHLTTGEIVYSFDSMKTLKARLDLADEK